MLELLLLEALNSPRPVLLVGQLRGFAGGNKGSLLEAAALLNQRVDVPDPGVTIALAARDPVEGEGDRDLRLIGLPDQPTASALTSCCSDSCQLT